MARTVIGIVFACALVPGAWADPLPAGVQACASETDADKRLACYDREAARIVVPATPPKAKVVPGSTPPVASPAPDARPVILTTDPAQKAQHLTAHVVHIEYSADEMRVQLDNDQVWRTVPDSVRISLREGDAVELDRQWGSWWLAGPHGRAIEVRQQK